MKPFCDPLTMPRTGETPVEVYERGVELFDTPGAAYAMRRGVGVEIAHEAGVRYLEDFAGRPALIVALRNRQKEITSVHGRYLSTLPKENKMFTVGRGHGLIEVNSPWQGGSLILVEGLFDALSLAQGGFSSCATIGREASWLPGACRGREVWLAFDASKTGEKESAKYRAMLEGAVVKKLPLPPRCLDWNTALLKKGAPFLTFWIGSTLKEDHEEP